MEALPSLPPELVAFAAPMAREGAPLLGSGAAETEPGDGAQPFELYLALMTGPQPAGEAWPASGKELPLAVPIAASAQQQAPGLPAMLAADAALAARLNLAATDAGATLPGTGPVLALSSAEVAAPLSVTSTELAAPIEAATPQTAAIAEAAANISADVAEAAPPEVEALASQLAPADAADAATTLEHAAAQARAPRTPAPSVAEPQLAAATHPRSALGARDAQPVEAAPRDGGPALEVTKLSQTVLPAVAEAASAANEWLPAGHTTTASSAHTAAQPAAAAGAPVDLRAPNWQEAFASRVQWLVGSNGGEARITLNPPELGAVDVKVSLVDDKTYVQLTTATAAARDELSQSLPRLRELFAASGLELGGASVHDGGHGSRAGYGDGRAAPAPVARMLAPLAELAEEPSTAAVPRRSLGRVDVFA